MEFPYTPSVPAIQNSDDSYKGTPDSSFSAIVAHSGSVLLPTAQVIVYDKYGKPHRTKALLDSGSMSSFIDASFCKRLGLKEFPTNMHVSGITMASTILSAYCQVSILSASTGFTINADCVVIPKITTNLPPATVSLEHLNIPPNLILADPNFNNPSEINLLIGADYFWTLLRSGRYGLGQQRPILQETAMGWIVSGPMPFLSEKTVSFFCKVDKDVDIDSSLTKFWELEDIPSIKLLTKEEEFCESHFVKNTTRDDSGRFVVRIPFKNDPNHLGESSEIAKRRFFSLERKLAVNSPLKERYLEFMEKYEDLDHMSPVHSRSSEMSIFCLIMVY